MPDSSNPDQKLAEEFQSHIDDLAAQSEQAPRSYTAPLRNASRMLNRLADDLANQPGLEIADHTALILDTMACRYRAAAPGNLLWGTRLAAAAVEMQNAADVARNASKDPEKAVQDLRDIASKMRAELADAGEYDTRRARLSTSASLVNRAVAAFLAANDATSRQEAAAILATAAASYQAGIVVTDSPWPDRIIEAAHRLTGHPTASRMR